MFILIFGILIAGIVAVGGRSIVASALTFVFVSLTAWMQLPVLAFNFVGIPFIAIIGLASSLQVKLAI
jgi:hypothetical protein